MKKKLIAIIGPTAVGKTATAVDLARHFETVVLNADSRQVFKELAIGTAKPSMDEMGGVRHYFVDDRSIEKEFSAGHFEAEGLNVLEKEFKNRDVVLLSGGSGLYVNALCEGLSEFPEVDSDLRERLVDEYSSKGITYLQQQIGIYDPAYAETADFENPQRLMRALEVSMMTGKPYSEFRTGASIARKFSTIYIGLELPRDILYDRINQRVDRMIDAGLFDEARRVLEFRDINALKTIGYKEVFGHLDGEYDYEEAVRLLKRNTRRFSKRQMTWFKKNPDIRWFDPADLDQIKSYLENELSIS